MNKTYRLLVETMSIVRQGEVWSCQSTELFKNWNANVNTIQTNKCFPYDETESSTEDVLYKTLWTLDGNVLIGVCVPDWIKLR